MRLTRNLRCNGNRPIPRHEAGTMTQRGAARVALRSASRVAGFTMIELMVAIALGLLVLTALTLVFVDASQGRREITRTSRQIESGRYAIQVLSDDLRQAGYYGEFNPSVKDGGGAYLLPTPVGKPNPCATDVPTLKAALPLHVQGYDVPAAAGEPGCLSDRRSGTDIIVVRRASSCVAGAADCEGIVAGTPYFQASLCNDLTELASATVTDWYALDTNVVNLTRHRKDCQPTPPGTLADRRRYRTHIYFIANNDAGADGLPTLKRAELGATGFTIVPLVEGIENLQVEYGLDNDSDGAPDVYAADPDTYDSGGGCVGTCNWRKVVAAKISLLARNFETSPSFTDSKVYTVGYKADGTANTITPGTTYTGGGVAPCAAAATCYPVGYKRHAYQTNVRLNNVSGRNSTP